MIAPGVPNTPTTGGGIVKKGPSSLFLLGNHTFTGTTHVMEGQLNLVGSIRTDLVIDPGTTVSGEFSVVADSQGHGGNLICKGTLLPGISGAGTINVAGDLTIDTTGRLVVDITPDGTIFDKVLGADHAILNQGSTLEVVLNSGNYIAGTTYTIIDAPVTGTFKVIESGTEAGNVNVEVQYSSVVLTVIDNYLFQTQCIAPGTPREVSQTIAAGTLIPNTDFARIVEILGQLDNEAVNKALIDLSPTRFGVIEWLNLRNNSEVASILREHINILHCSPRDCIRYHSRGWVDGFEVLDNNQTVTGDLTPFDSKSAGAILGYDWCFPSQVYLGVATSYIASEFDWKHDGGKGSSNTFYGSLYASVQKPSFTLDLSLLGGGSDYSIHRKIEFSTVDRTARSNFWGTFLTGHLGFEKKFKSHQWEAKPFAVTEYHYFHQNRFREKGADSIDLNVHSKTQNFIRGEAGVRIARDIVTDEGCFSPYIGISWVGDFPLSKSQFKASFIGQKPVMNVTSYSESEQMGSPQAGVHYTHSSGVSLIAGYKGLYNDRVRITNLEGRLEWTF